MQTINETTIDAARLEAAMLATISELAGDAQVDAETAAVLPVSLSAAFADLCRWLGIPAPTIVQNALGERVTV